MGKSKEIILPGEKMQELSFTRLKEKLQGVVDRLHQLVSRVTKKTDLALFLIDVCKDFELDQKDKLENLTIFTLLEALKYEYLF